MPRIKKPLPDFDQPLTDDELAKLYAQATEPPPADPQPAAPELWLPSLTPGPQMDAFLDETENTLVVGNRFSGKGWSCGYNLVKHAYDYYNALALVVVRTARQGLTGGFFSKIGADILPDFKKNLEGFDYRGPFLSTNKDTLFTVTNRYGGVSIIQLLSVLHDVDLDKKILGVEASKVYCDEVTLFESEAVFTQLKGTLKRRNHIPPEAQTYLCTTNPDDPDHWVSQRWGLVIGKDGTLDVDATNAKSPDYRVIEIDKDRNPDPKVAAYYKNLHDSLRNQPTKAARQIHGKWVALPKGDAIFREQWVREVHVRGDLSTGEVLQPVVNSPITIGYDCGDVNHGVSFLQEIYTNQKVIWIAFDEIEFVGKKIGLETVAEQVLARMQYWCEEMDFDFSFGHISDRSAFDRFRSANGSFDHATIERHSREVLKNYPRLKSPIRMKPCPKPDGSVAARTRMLMDMLTREEIYVSAKCQAMIAMFEKITGKPDDPFSPATRSPYKHMYDSLGYPLFYSKCGGSVVPQTSGPQPQIIQMGA